MGVITRSPTESFIYSASTHLPNSQAGDLVMGNYGPAPINSHLSSNLSVLGEWGDHDEANLTEVSDMVLNGEKSDEDMGLAGGGWGFGSPRTPLSIGTVSEQLLNATYPHTNDTGEEHQPDVLGPTYHRQLRVGILAVMLVVALIGNSRVMWKLWGKWAKRGRMTIMSFNLTLADMLVALVTILGQLMWEVLDKHWYLGNGACKLYKVVSTFAITSSNYVLVAIAIDRHEAVVRPLNPFISARNLALSAWAVSLLPSLPNLFIFFRHETPNGVAYCVSKFYTNDLDNNFRQVYLTMVLVLVFISCLVLLLLLYLRIYCTIWRQNSYFKSGQRGASESRRTNSLLPKAKTKTLNMTIVIVATFFITNIPYVIQELMMSFGGWTNINPNMVALFGIISASNSCFNPFIYLFFCPKNEQRSPQESYRVTFTRRWNTLNGRDSTTPGSIKVSLTTGKVVKNGR